MEKEIKEKYAKAMEISSQVMPFAKSLIKEDAKVLMIGDEIEGKIKSLGGGLAFPVNISIDDIAAHYTPDINDSLVLKNEDLVKIDFGVQIDGYISDQAFTVFVGKKSHPLIDAAEKAVSEAVKILKPGVRVFEISDVIVDVVNEFGFNPIQNLCGHGLDHYIQHASPTIPNGRNTIAEKIESGKAIAMEVFTTNGEGSVKESSPTLIYRYLQDRPMRMLEARKILEVAKKDFEELPFAKRWLAKTVSGMKLDFALRQLVENNALEAYPVLKEETNGLVAQYETTLVVE